MGGGDTLVLYPAPGIGHLISMVELGKSVIQRRRFSAIHILITTGFNNSSTIDAYLHQISKTIPSITFHRFPFIQANPSPNISFATTGFDFIRLNAANVHHALQQISQTSSIQALILDFFCSSAVPISESLGIPVYFFFTSGLAALSLYLYFPTLHKIQIGAESFKDLVDTKFDIPGLPPLLSKHMPQPLLDMNDPAYFDIMYCSHHLARSSGILVNTFDGLEPIAMEAITGGLCIPDSPTPPIFNIGPLIADSESKSLHNDDYCFSWLDKQENQSVVFLCFGSRGAFSSDQVKEIAKGLERSGQRFLWVVKKPPSSEKSKEIEDLGWKIDVEGIMPEGFLDRTKERGMVAETWVPQTAVLKHPAVAGFVTHCGWNSVLEAVMNGVPMVAWPLYAEQHLNRYALVEHMKIAVKVEQREEDGFVSAEEVEKKIVELMDWEKSGEIRIQCDKMKRMAIDGFGELGSSYTALTQVIQAWLGK